MIGFAEIAGGAPSSTSGMTGHLLNNTLSPEQAQIAAYYAHGTDRESDMLFRAKAVVAGIAEFDAVVDRLTEKHFEAQGIDISTEPTNLVEEAARAVVAGEASFQEAADHLVQFQAENDQDFYGPNFEVNEREVLDRLEATVLRADAQQDTIDGVREKIAHRVEVLVDRVKEGLLDAPLAVVRPDTNARALVGLGIEKDGLLSADEINALLAGRRTDGKQVEGKRYAPEKAMKPDPKTGARRWATPIGAYDFCPTPSKSISVGWAFGTDHEKALILNAHTEAAREAVAYIADTIGKVRLGDGGQDGTENGHVTWLEFTHHTSRRVQVISGEGEAKIVTDAGMSGDPDLHTHFLIPNAVFSESGKVGSLDTMGIRGFIFEADAFYHARLAQKLRDSGFDVGLDKKTGAATLHSVPDNVVHLFSKRTNKGEEMARDYTANRGEVWDELTPQQRMARIKQATQSLEQRVEGDKDPVAEFQDWKIQAKEKAGWEPTSLQLYGPPVTELTGPERHRVAYEIGQEFLAEKLEQRSVMTHWDLRVAALRGMVHTGISGLGEVKDVTRLMFEEGVQQYGDKTAIMFGQEQDKRYVSVTTVLHDKQEKEFIQLAKAATTDRRGAIPEGLLLQKINQSGLDFSDEHGRAQRAAIERVGAGGKFSLIIAAAGSGKTTSLQPLVAAWKEQGRTVYGASLAWRQADDLTEAGIDRRNVKAFSVLMDAIREARDPNPKAEYPPIPINSRSVIAVDEWAMLGTRQGLELLRHQEAIGFTIVALGDPKQTASVEAGNIIDLSRRVLGATNVPEITTTKRQRTDREKAIVGLLRDGKAAEALSMKRSDGTAEMAPGGRAGVIARVAEIYVERLKETGQAPGINTPTNSDAHDISVVVRQERRKLGMVGPDLKVFNATDGEREYDLPLAAGDRVRLFKSTNAKYGEGRRGAIGRNGSVIEVVGITDTHLMAKSRTGKVGSIRLEDLEASNGRIKLAYGDAMTIHSSQGSNRGEQISALPNGSQVVDGGLAYTMMTRHFFRSHLVTNDQVEHTAVRKSRPINSPHEITLDDKWAMVAKAFSNQTERDTVAALRERAGRLRQGAVKAFLKVTQPAGARPSQAPSIRQQRSLETIARELKEAVQKTSLYQRVVHHEQPRHTQTHERRGPRHRQ